MTDAPPVNVDLLERLRDKALAHDAPELAAPSPLHRLEVRATDVEMRVRALTDHVVDLNDRINRLSGAMIGENPVPENLDEGLLETVNDAIGHILERLAVLEQAEAQDVPAQNIRDLMTREETSALVWRDRGLAERINHAWRLFAAEANLDPTSNPWFKTTFQDVLAQVIGPSPVDIDDDQEESL